MVKSTFCVCNDSYYSASFARVPVRLQFALNLLYFILLSPPSYTEKASSCMLRLWTINGRKIERTHVEVMVHCLSYTAAPEGLYVNALIGGLANGNIR